MRMKGVSLRGAAIVALFSVACLFQNVRAFVPSPSQRVAEVNSALQMSSFFNGIGKFFLPDDHEGDRSEVDDDDDYQLGTSRIVTIPVESIKPGGLRLFLMFYLMGEQNTPEEGAWRIDQPTTEEYAVDVYYHDRTAVLTIRLTQDQVTVDRMGSMPSTSYIMQEAVIVDGILDELQRMVVDEDVKRDDRLILLKDEDAIVNAREALAFG
jgi:hypothetical protein